MKYFFTAFLLLPFILQSQTTPPDIQWSKCYGGSDKDISYDVLATSDGGCVIAGSAASGDGDILGINEGQHNGDYDYWLVKLDASSNIEWKRHAGGPFNDAAQAVVAAADGSFLMGGATESNNGDVSGNHGSFDFWIIKVSAAGALQGGICLGGTQYEYFKGMDNTADGGLIMCGSTNSNDGDVSGNHGFTDVWLVKTDAGINITWQKCLGGSSIEIANHVIATSDGGYLAVGNTSSNNGDVSGNHGGSSDGWAVKVDAAGNLEWQHCFGGSQADVLNDVLEMPDGSFLAAGSTNSDDGDVSGHYGAEDFWLLKIDAAGNLLWQKCFGGSLTDVAYSVNPNYEGGWLLGGYTNSGDGEVTDSLGGYDYWIVSTDSAGNLVWQQSFGGSLNDVCYGAATTNDEGYFLTGYSDSQDGEVIGHHLKEDYWVVRLAGLLGVQNPGVQLEISVYPNPVEDLLHFNLPQTSIAQSIIITGYDGRLARRTNAVGRLLNNEVNVSDLPPGLYFIEVKTADAVWQGRFVKR